jgi:hypothetical protein
MISLGSKPLIVVDPVMVVLFKRREMVTHLPARFLELGPVIPGISPDSEGPEQSSESIR